MGSITVGPNAIPTLKDYFLNNSSFRPLRAQPPAYFVDLEQHLEPRVANLGHQEYDPMVVLAANLCRRLADVIVYALDIQRDYRQPRDGQFLLVATRLVGYYAATKALLDAGAITLTALYGLVNRHGLPLTPKQQDFNKGDIWNALAKQQDPVHARYKGFRSTFDDIRDWRDAIVHRTTPLTLKQLARFPGTNKPAEFMGCVMALDRNASVSDLIEGRSQTVPPTHHHTTWGPVLDRFCKELCVDIKANS
jgi:hypothetical protein